MAKQDKYHGADIGLSDPSNEAYAVVPHATNALAQGAPKFIFVGTGGNLVCKLSDSDVDVTYKNLADGSWHPIRPTHIRATSTAADIVAHY